MKITAKLFEKEYRGERVSIPIADLPLELLTPEEWEDFHQVYTLGQSKLNKL